MQDRSNLLTEQPLTESADIDALPIEQAIDLMNAQDALAVRAVGAERANIARAVELIVAGLRAGGRLIYVGAGTSGRLGVLDAAECPPTFRTDPATVQAFIAGGDQAVFRSQEGAEDNAAAGHALMDQHQIGLNDTVVGIAAGGTTPFVHGALRHAKTRAAKTVLLACVPRTDNEAEVDIAIRPLTGPEVITGSTRLKAGTATKLVLNILSTLAMVQLGKVYGHWMVDMHCSNDKLWDRGTRLVARLTGADYATALERLQQAGGHVKSAIVMQTRSLNLPEAQALLNRHRGLLRSALAE